MKMPHHCVVPNCKGNYLTKSKVSMFAFPKNNIEKTTWIIAKISHFRKVLQFGDYFEKYYMKPYTRIGPYLVGIVLAYIMFKRSITKKRISFVVLSIGWIIATALGLICVYGLYYKTPSVLGASFYNSLCRICYAASLSWVIFVCLSGQGGPVDKILSYKLFIPLSRLTYAAYLIHPIILSSYFGSMKTTFDFTHVTIVTVFLGLILVTYAVSLLVSLVFESPIIRLEKLVRSKFES